MKKSLIVLLLAGASLAAQAQTPAAGQEPSTAPANNAPAAGAPAANPAPKKVIADPTEYNAYVAAINATDPAQKAQLMESYLQTYPNSVMKDEGLEVLLKAYQKLNKTEQMKTVSQRLLDVNPNNLTALFVLSYLDHVHAQEGGADAATAMQEAGKIGARGLQALASATKPEGYTDEQWNSVKTTFRTVFLGSVGEAALQAKDYATAQQDAQELVSLQPGDLSSIYLLARAYLEVKPPAVEGLFWIARAAGSAPQLMPYAKSQYVRYHGSEEGFDELVASAKAAPTIPAGFTVKPAPSPADQAAEMLQKGTPEKLSFAEWQFILSYGSKDSSDQVWTAIKGKPVALVAVVVETAAGSLKLAGSVDDIEAKKADITLNLKQPLDAARVPKAGTELTVQGTPADYSATADGFNMVFGDGEVLKGLSEPQKKPAAGVHHKPTQ